VPVGAALRHALHWAQGDRSSLQALHAALLAVPSSVDQFRGKEFDAEAEVGHWTDLGSKLGVPFGPQIRRRLAMPTRPSLDHGCESVT
jgi:hypothetical protein